MSLFKKGIDLTIESDFKRPKRIQYEKKIKTNTLKKKNQSLIKDSLIFCVLKSVHFEFLKTLPKLATTDLYLLLRSKKDF